MTIELNILRYLTTIRITEANRNTNNQKRSCIKLTVYTLLAYLLCESGKLHTIIKHIHIRKKLCTCPDQQQQRGGVKHIKLFFYRFLSFIDISKISVFLRVVVRLVESWKRLISFDHCNFCFDAITDLHI